MYPLERFEITQQPKRQVDILMLLDEVKRSPFIGEISPDEITRLLREDAVLFFYEGDILAGLAGWNTIHGTWVEAGPFYTAEAYRGQGLGSLMFDTTVERLQRQAGHKLYAVTKNPMVKLMFLKRGFHQVRIWALPRAVQVYLLKKLTPRRLLRHVRKLRFGDSVSHFIKDGSSG
ncbi:MAG: GNAT family N-acetyltransferase [Chloroflexi bacterium]|nr:GNAT family N-acetyltransferase [Chloroflexota bacterium]